ncbi:hypothetical protein [Paenibacillus sp. YYML68]|uniref:hypothetical protein n=1 Tax=Paenibacillus sp. YYML68 TaxID=2909250 RepID=UPI0024920028|nr:hypothetical protein [Paenibacillus sp. YYML68]
MGQELQETFEEVVMNLKEHEEVIVRVRDRAYVVAPATADDVKRIVRGEASMD